MPCQPPCHPPPPLQRSHRPHPSTSVLTRWLLSRLFNPVKRHHAFKGPPKFQSPKNTSIIALNNYRLVSLTFVVMQAYEHLALIHLRSITGHDLDRPVFGYQANRWGTYDSLLNEAGRYTVTTLLLISSVHFKILFHQFFNLSVSK